MNLLYVVVCVLMLPIDSPAVIASVEAAEKAPPWDCGTLALYHLLRLEGRATELSRLQSLLGTPGAEGRSIRELREVARQCGLPLDAVVLPREESAIRGPTLVFLKNGSEGHFVVSRPVGHTGHLWQVLDGERTPAIADAQRLFGSPSWTGIALVPRQTNYFVVVAVGVSFCCIIMLGFVTWKRRRSTQGLPWQQIAPVNWA